MIISHKYKFIFIKTRKTASTSIEQYLIPYISENDIITPNPFENLCGRNYEGYFNPLPFVASCLRHMNFKSFTGSGIYIDYFNMGKIFRTFEDLVNKRKFYQHISAIFVKNRVPRNIWNNYFKFCVERNPYDKTISYYFWKARERKNYSFEQYMIERDFCHNYPMYTDLKQEEPIVDRIIYYENFNKELQEVFDQLGIPFKGSLDEHAKSKYRKDSRSYADFFSGENEKYIDHIRDAFQKEIKLHGYYF